METKTKRPGSALIAGGLALAVLITLFQVAAIAEGGYLSGVLILGVLAGLVLAGIGFAVRVLAALEKR